MPCYSPLTGWRGRGGVLVFKRSEACGFKQVVSCGQCIGCRLERARQWAIRIMHESELYEDNSFITLTYADQALPVGGTLVKSHFQDFMKRLRSRLAPRKIRFFHCGEYGEKFSRPHYHAIIFGYEFADKVFYKEAREGRLFISEFLSNVWSRGFCTVGDVSFESAGYVARYCLKKINGALKDDHYWIADEVTGEAHQVLPEYCTMSNRPGIGAEWFLKFGSDVFPSDEVVARGFPSKPPRFYDGLYEIDNPVDFDRIRRDRMVASRKRSADNTPERLEVRETCKLLQVDLLARSYEHGA